MYQGITFKTVNLDAMIANNNKSIHVVSISTKERTTKNNSNDLKQKVIKIGEQMAEGMFLPH